MKMYRLEGKLVVEEPDMMKAMKSFTEDRTLKFTSFDDLDVKVSTVFLAIDTDLMGGISKWGKKKDPLIFETLVQGGVLSGTMDRYRSFDGAIMGHHAVCRVVAIAEAEKRLENVPKKSPDGSDDLQP